MNELEQCINMDKSQKWCWMYKVRHRSTCIVYYESMHFYMHKVLYNFIGKKIEWKFSLWVAGSRQLVTLSKCMPHHILSTGLASSPWWVFCSPKFPETEIISNFSVQKNTQETQSLFLKTLGSDSIKSKQIMKGLPSHFFKSAKYLHTLNYSTSWHTEAVRGGMWKC